MGDCGADGVLGHVPSAAMVVGYIVTGQRSASALHDVSRLPGPQDHLADATHGLRVAADDRDRAHVVQHVLGGDGGRADAALCEGQIFGHRRVQVMAHHQHVEVLGQCVDRVRACRVGRRWQHVGMRSNGDDVGGMATACALGVIRVDRATLDGGECRFDVAGLVQGVGVDCHLHARFVGNRQARIDCGRCGAPVLVQLEPTRATDDLLPQCIP